MNQKLRSLFLVPSLVRAGAETQAIDLINGLSNDKHEKYLFTFHPNEDQKSRLDLQKISYWNQPRKYKLDLSPAITIADIIDRERIDVIHCTLQISLFLGWAARLLSKNTPALISTIHTTINRSVKDDAFDHCMYRFMLKKCHKVIFVCYAQQEYWTKRFAFLSENSQVIYNGIDVKKFSPDIVSDSAQELKRSLGIEPDAHVVSSLANFRPEKGHLHLCEALSLAKKPIHLILAGEGPLKKKVQNFVQRTKMKRYVHFLGSVEDVRPILAVSDLMVIASTAVETFSIAMLESMCMGIPVLATNIGGMSEAILHGKTGFLVPPGSPVMLSKAILEALQSDEALKQMGQNAKRLVLEKFSADTMVHDTELLMDSTVSKNLH